MTQVPPPTAPGPPSLVPELPGATAGLVLGICSIVFNNLPLIGLILGFIGLQKSREAKAWGEMYPGVYSNQGVAQAGFVCSTIGLILSALSTAAMCCGFILLVFFAAAAAGQ